MCLALQSAKTENRITLNNRDLHRKRQDSFATACGSSANIYQLGGTPGSPLKPNSYQCRWCRSTHVGNTLPTVVSMDWVSRKITCA